MTRLAILLRSALLVLTLVCTSQTMARSQQYKVTIKVKEQKLLDVFKSIQQQTKLIVFYSNTILNDQEKVSIQVKDEPLEKVLDQIVAGKALQYDVQAKYIVISPKEEKKAAGSLSTELTPGVQAPPPPVITGRVTNENDEPVAGVSIAIKGGKVVALTDEAGSFRIENIADNAILVFSGVNINTVEISVNGRAALAVKVKNKVSELKEVIVGKGYYEEKEKYSVSNVTRVTSKDLEKSPVSNVMLALQGRVPGLDITQETGMNGGAVKIRIQGENSMANGNDPLIIVDGVPYPTNLPTVSFSTALIGNSGMGSPLSFLNMDDIESIDVLKDADATSIYGSRAANGAIVITTKKGKPGKMRLNLNLQQGWSKVTRRMEMLNTRQYLDMRYEAMRNSALIPTDKTGLASPYVFAPDLTIWDTTRYTDWQKELIGGTAQFSNFNASLSGGSVNSNYLVGLTYNRQTDVFPGEYALNTGALHFNINAISLNQKFKVSLSGSYSINNNSLPGADLTEAAIKLVPVAPALFSGDTLNWAPDAGGIDTWDNPLVNSYYNQYFSAGRALNSNATFSYLLLPGLELRSQLGYNNVQSNSNIKFPLIATRPASRPTTTRSASFNTSISYNYIFEPQVLYNKELGRLQINTLIGATLQQNNTQSTSISGSGYTSDLLLDGLSGAPSIGATINKSVYRYNALFARVGMIWNNAILLNINARRDGSSRFGEENRFHNFGSIGAGWIFTELKPLQSISSWLNFGKLRMSYGTTGSDQVGEYAYLSRNAPLLGVDIAYQGTSSFYTDMLSNPYLQWEETRKLQIGTDLGLFKDRLRLNITYSQNRCSNQLISYNVPAITGFNSVKQNLPATLQNTSWEFVVATVNMRARELQWTSSVNFTIPQNKVTEFPGIENSPYSTPLNGIVVGQPKGVKLVSSYMGMNPATGLHVAADRNGNPSTSPSNNQFLSIAPLYYGGFQNSVTYGSISIDFLISFMKRWGTQAFTFWNGSQVPGYQLRGIGNQNVSVLDRWQTPGNQSLVAPFSAVAGTPGIIATSDAFYSTDASYVRLKNISLSWQMSQATCKKLGLQSARLYTQGQNLFTITRFSGLDPENQSSTSLPPLRTWTIGIQVGL